MPTYQYACKACVHSFEQVQKFSDDALTICPECQGRLRKVFNAVGVVFKGSGFYRTDSRSPEKVPASSSSSSSSSLGSDAGSTSSSASSDSKSSSTPAKRPSTSSLSGSSSSSTSASSAS